MKNKKEISLLGGVVVLVIVIVLLAKYQGKVESDAQKQNNSTQTSSSQTSASQNSAPSSSAVSQGAKKLSYAEAMKAYPNRIQFVNCGGNPGTVSVKRNTPVMLDNRDKKTHAIRGGGQSFNIPALDYAVMYPKNEGTFQLTCDGGGSSILNVEK